MSSLSQGGTLREEIVFPGATRLSYLLEPVSRPLPSATFIDGGIRIGVPADLIRAWATGEEIGLYFDFAADRTILKLAIEKDLECVDGAPEEYDPDAFPRPASKECG